MLKVGRQLQRSRTVKQARFVLLAAVLAAQLAVSVASAQEERSLQSLIAALSSADPDVQQAGMFDLFFTHDGVLACLPALVDIAIHSTPQNRAEALRLIAGFGPHGKSATDKLRDLFKADNARVRICAAHAILSLETHNEAAVAVLGQALRTDSADDRKVAADDLATHGIAASAATEALIAALADPDTDVRVEVARALGLVAAPGQPAALAALRKCLTDESPRIRGSAATALWNLGEPADALMPTLIRLVADYRPDRDRNPTDDIWGHDAGIELLNQIGAEATAAIPALIAALDSPQTGERLAAADSLGAIGPAAAPAIYRLERSLRETETHTFPLAHHAWYVSDQAAAALRQIGPVTRPALLAALADKDDRVRALAAEQLGWFAADRPTTTALILLLDDKTEFVRAAAAASLGRLKSTAAAPQLAAHLNDTGAWVSFPGGGIGSNFSVGQHILDALDAIDPAPEQILPALTNSLKKDRRLPPVAVELLCRLGPPAKEAAGAIEPLLREESQRLNAAIALAAIAPDYPGLLAILQAALVASSNGGASGPAARGLGDLGSRANSALPALYAALEKEQMEPEIVAAAIVKIDPCQTKAVRALAEALRESASAEALAAWRAVAPTTAAADEILLAGLAVELPGKDRDYFDLPRKEMQIRLRSAELLIDRRRHLSRTVDALIRLCDGDDCSVRGGAADAIGRLGPAAAKAAAALVPMLADEELYLIGGDFYGNGGSKQSPGEHAQHALAKIGAPAVTALRGALAQERWHTRQRAALALGEIGTPATAAASELRSHLRDPQPEVRAAAAQALGGIRDSQDVTIAGLSTALADKRLQVRVAAARALGNLGAASEPAREALLLLKSDPFEPAQQAAAQALAQIPQ